MQADRTLAAVVAAAMAVLGLVNASAVGAAGSTAVDDDVTAVVNSVGGSVNVLTNDVRTRSGPFNTFAVVYPESGPTAAGGSVSCTSNACAYTAPPGFVGPDSFTYRLTYPSFGGGNTGPTSLATVRVTVVANEAPTALDDEATVRSQAQVEVVENDTDPNRLQVGERLTVAAGAPFTTPVGAVVSCPAEGSQQACAYTPAPGYSGTDSFEYTVVDVNGASDVGTVTVTVPPNQPPVALDDAFEGRVRYGSTLLPLQFAVLANDSDPDGDSITSQAVAPGTSAGGQVDCSWVCQYTPPTGFYGTDTFSYSAVDGLGALSAPATVTVTVVPDDPPVAVDDVAATKGTRTVQVAVLDNDTDDHGAVSLVNSWTDGGSDLTSANGGTVQCFDSMCSYTPPSGFVGADSFHYVINDGVSTSAATVTVSVAANAAPVAVDDPGSSGSTTATPTTATTRSTSVSWATTRTPTAIRCRRRAPASPRPGTTGGAPATTARSSCPSRTSGSTLSPTRPSTAMAALTGQWSPSTPTRCTPAARRSGPT